MTPPPDPSQVALGRFVRGLLALLAAEVVVLAATGAYLFFEYRPTASAAWADIFGADPTEVQGWRVVHRGASFAAVATAMAAGVLMVAAAVRSAGRWALAGSVVAVVVAGSFTGYLLPWDQLALWAVTVGTDVGGYELLWTDDVRFVLLGGVEVGTSTLRWWMVVHLVLGTAALVLPVLGWRRIRP